MATVAVAGFLAFLFFVHPRPQLPAGCGARGPDFELRCAGEDPYLMVNGLPYPTDFEGYSHPVRMLSGTWRFRLDPEGVGEAQRWHELAAAPADWEEIQVPSTFNAPNSGRAEYQGQAWYFTTFDAPAAAPGELVRLRFHGVLRASDVWLNGSKLGHREGGYTPFFFDVGERLAKDGPNRLVVRVDNRLVYDALPPRLDERHRPGWAPYGGIYRDVALERLPRTYVFKVDARTKVSGGEVGFDVRVFVDARRSMAPHTLKVAVVGPGGAPTVEWNLPPTFGGDVVVHRMDVPLEAPRWYSPASPELYTVVVTLESPDGPHRVSLQTGLRTVEVRPNALWLNGERIFLKGINKHEDDPALGATQTALTIERDLRLIQELNANFVRLAHYPHDAREVRRARDLGLLMLEEIPFYQVGTGYVAWYEEGRGVLDFPVAHFGMRQLGDAALLLNAQRDLAELIERDRNNPAVILWSVANESYTLMGAAGEVHGWLSQVAKALDPTRPTTLAELTYDIPLLDGLRAGAASVDVPALNVHYGRAEQVEAHLDDFHARHPDRPLLVTELGAEGALGRGDAEDQLIRTYVELLRRKDYVAGVSPWVPKKAFRSLQRLYAEPP